MTPPNGISGKVGTNSGVLKEHCKNFLKQNETAVKVVRTAFQLASPGAGFAVMAREVYNKYLSNAGPEVSEDVKILIKKATPVPITELVKDMPNMDQICIGETGKRIAELAKNARTGNHREIYEQMRNRE